VAYDDFLTLWKGADSNIHLLQQAKTEYGSLQLLPPILQLLERPLFWACFVAALSRRTQRLDVA
jgi:hypothetical protein